MRPSPGSSSRRRPTCFVTHYGTRPDFCQGADPASKGIVEALVGYVKSDIMVPEELRVTDLARANAKGVAWSTEVNAQVHSEIAAVPAERLEIERPLLGALPSLRAHIGKVVQRKVDRLSCVRFGSARYSVPTAHIGRQVELRVADGRLLELNRMAGVAIGTDVAPTLQKGDLRQARWAVDVGRSCPATLGSPGSGPACCSGPVSETPRREARAICGDPATQSRHAE